MKKFVAILLAVNLLCAYAVPVNAAEDSAQRQTDSVTVEPIAPQYYTSKAIKVSPVVKAGNVVLKKDVDYKLSYKNNVNVSTDAQVTVTGLGAWADFSKTLTFPILKRDISECHIYVQGTRFNGEPADPYVLVEFYKDGNLQETLTAGEDYVVYLQNDINIGEASYCIVGIGNYCGYATGKFNIGTGGWSPDLKGTFNGYYNGTLNDKFYYEEVVMTPGPFTGKIYSVVGSTYRDHYAIYELYRLVGEKTVLVAREESEYGHSEFEYDFSFVYEDAVEDGGAIYMLSYSWVDSRLEVYSGVYVMFIPAKVPDATAMVLEHIPVPDDFRRAYLCAYGTDGNVGEATWRTSNSAVATVNDNGVVTFKTPGTVTITAKYGNLTASRKVTASVQDFTNCDIVYYDPETKQASVYYKDQLLTAGTDYILTVSESAGVVTLTAAGIGLFAGELVKTFDGLDSFGDTHSHSFDNSCDGTCNGCDFTRSNDHSFTDKTTWSKNPTHHYYACTACGHPEELFEHSFLGDDHTVCSVCGDLYPIGDVNGDCKIDSLDGLTLLKYLNGWAVELYSPDTTDLNQDGKIDSLDGLILMRYLNGWDIALG